MEYENILYQTDGAIATITLNRPDKLNALSEDLQLEVSSSRIIILVQFLHEFLPLCMNLNRRPISLAFL